MPGCYSSIWDKSDEPNTPAKQNVLDIQCKTEAMNNSQEDNNSYVSFLQD